MTHEDEQYPEGGGQGGGEKKSGDSSGFAPALPERKKLSYCCSIILFNDY